MNEETACAQIFLERTLGDPDGSASIPPTLLEDEEASIGVEVTDTSGGEEFSEELQERLQPAEVTPLTSESLIASETVSRRRLEELIGDQAVIEKLIADRPLDQLAFTITRHEFKVRISRTDGETLIERVVAIQSAAAEDAKVKVYDLPGCTIPEYAELDEEKTVVRYRVPVGKMRFRNRDGEYRGGDYWVGPYLSWYDEERTIKRSESCYNEYSELHGTASVWYKNGEKEKETEYRDGRRHGTETTWYESGEKKFEGQYIDGKKSGTHTAWHEDGHKRYEESYTDDKQDGLSSYWGASKPGGDIREGIRGMKIRDEFYRDGELVKKIYYSVHTGIKGEEHHYRNGKQHGQSLHYFPNGALAFTRNYVDGKQHGAQQSYDKEGRLCSTDYYANGEFVRVEFTGNCR